MIPQDPTRPEYRQGGTLSERHKHWFRAKFFQQYRLFFRYRVPSKVIVFAWVNDEKTKRAFEGGNDAYRVFRKMVENGHPPDDWGALLAESKVGVKRWYLPTCAVFGIRFLLDNGNRYPINVFSINVDDIGVDSENGK